MARQVKTVLYEVQGVWSLMDLLEMMRYDGMRFPSTTRSRYVPGEKPDWQHVVSALAKRSAGLVDVNDPPIPATITVAKDQVKDWQPTEGRWSSFGMGIQRLTSWEESRTIN